MLSLPGSVLTADQVRLLPVSHALACALAVVEGQCQARGIATVYLARAGNGVSRRFKRGHLATRFRHPFRGQGSFPSLGPMIVFGRGCLNVSSGCEEFATSRLRQVTDTPHRKDAGGAAKLAGRTPMRLSGLFHSRLKPGSIGLDQRLCAIKSFWPTTRSHGARPRLHQKGIQYRQIDMGRWFGTHRYRTEFQAEIRTASVPRQSRLSVHRRRHHFGTWFAF